MQFEEYKNLWVFVETEENAAKSVGYELLSPWRKKQLIMVQMKLFLLKARNILTIQQMLTAMP